MGAAFGGDNGGSATDPLLTSNSRDAAFMGGGQIGADYQFAPNWLIGIEGQISGLSNNDRRFSDGFDTFRDRSNWLASVTGRLGYTWGPGLIYAKGGAAFRDDKGLDATPASCSVRPTAAAPVGPSVAASNTCSLRPGRRRLSTSTTTSTLQTWVTSRQRGLNAFSYKDDIHTVKVGVNYHFNWGGPVVAKY